jgi:hypothetical protein
VLIEKHHRLEPIAVDPDRKVKQSLVRSTNGPVLIALDYENAGRVRPCPRLGLI